MGRKCELRIEGSTSSQPESGSCIQGKYQVDFQPGWGVALVVGEQTETQASFRPLEPGPG